MDYDIYMTAKGAKQNKLTVKQSVFVKAFTDSSNKETFLHTRKAFAKATGVDEYTAYGRNGGYLMSRKPHVKAAIIEALHKQRITPEYQAKKLKELMEATKPIYHEGLKIDTTEDNEVRHKALVTSLKITDAIDNLESQMGQGIQINIAPEMAERLVKIAAEMRAMREAHSNQVIPLIEVKDGKS